VEQEKGYKMKKIIVCLFLSLPLMSFAFTWDIAQDGSGDFSEIQTTIDVAGDGDTLLIHPGTYYETLIIDHKNLHLMSLYGTTQDTTYIYTTIIDGNHQSNVVYSFYPSEGIKLTGLTVTGGYCNGEIENGFHHGAGIVLFGGYNTISQCNIEYNYSERMGGGIFLVNSSLYLSGSVIRFNVAVEGGGGLAFGNEEIIFDEEELNSIYGNYGAYGSDILNGLDPDYEYYLPMQKGTSNPPNQFYFNNHDVYDMFNVSYEECYVSETAQEVYVSPEGYNGNDGLTPETALRNVWYATLKCEGTEDEPGVIHLLPGTYSPSSNEEYPVTGLKSNMSVIGSGSDLAVLDRENRSGMFGMSNNTNNLLQGFTICNDSGEYRFFNISVTGNVSLTGTISVRDIVCRNIQGISIAIDAYNEIICENTKILDTSHFGCSIQLSSIYNTEFRNLEIRNSMYQEVEESWQYEGGFGIGIFNATNIQEPMNYYFENMLITGIDNRSPYQMYPSGSIYALGCSEEFNNVWLINSTISGNVTNNLNTTAVGAVYGSHLNIYNSIIYDNQYHSLKIGGYASAGESYIGVSHSLVEGGFEDMVDLGQPWTAEWLEGNLDIDENPGYCGVGKSEFALQENSPCIDSGTLDSLPEGYELCETDLAGNPRVYGEDIDMGCYEWQGTQCDFTWQQEQSTVTFSVISNEEIYDIGWDFECDEEIDSYELNPTHIYTENGTYSVGVYINEGRGGRKYENCLTIDSVGQIEEEIINTPLTCRNYPNPFNPRTTIEFDLPEKGEVRLNIYDIKGRKVKSMLNAVLEAGLQSFIWNGRNEDDIEVASGIYFYELKWEGQSIRNKINLLK
jgi:PKD repeat protein